ncbi:hypothetical protein THAOC_02604 [Thalassiosira oceanica]|uniref:WW domain-containing protein n=1 Tax=Thalassiosira oceanica TaxID=159749 RepID=K0TQ97_THAOC|nr:hypothetical protein THAOC_02604 [Thalassiosira oceanica]|eukprot:EJK75667.1 hypothetical protein THAOC_02604 [Thalassiosira oceanica]
MGQRETISAGRGRNPETSKDKTRRRRTDPGARAAAALDVGQTSARNWRNSSDPFHTGARSALPNVDTDRAGEHCLRLVRTRARAIGFPLYPHKLFVVRPSPRLCHLFSPSPRLALSFPPIDRSNMDGPGIKNEQFGGDTDDEYPGLRENDVLCVRGQTDLDYSGNDAFRKLMKMNKSIYESMNSGEAVRKFASSVVELIEKRSGRFLARKQDHGIIASFEEEEWTILNGEQASDVVLDSMKAELGSSSIISNTDAELVTETSGQNSIDPAFLVKLTAQQSKQMKYPPGCPVWYHMDTSETELHVSAGLVKGVSMDLTSRQLVYGVVPCLPEEHDTPTTFVTEEELAFASKCPVSIENPDTGEIIVGEVVNLMCFDGEKSYIVAFTISGNQMCIKQSSEEYIKFSSTRTKDNGDGNQQNNTIADARITEHERRNNVANNKLSRKRRKRQRDCHGGQESRGGNKDNGTNGRTLEGSDPKSFLGDLIQMKDQDFVPPCPLEADATAPGGHQGSSADSILRGGCHRQPTPPAQSGGGGVGGSASTGRGRRKSGGGNRDTKPRTQDGFLYRVGGYTGDTLPLGLQATIDQAFVTAGDDSGPDVPSEKRKLWRMLSTDVQKQLISHVDKNKTRVMFNGRNRDIKESLGKDDQYAHLIGNVSHRRSGTERVQTAVTIELPVNWASSIDLQTGKRFYWNRVTRETTWIRPRSPSDSPSLDLVSQSNLVFGDTWQEGVATSPARLGKEEECQIWKVKARQGICSGSQNSPQRSRVADVHGRGLMVVTVDELFSV